MEGHENRHELDPDLEALRSEWEKQANVSNELFDKIKDFADKSFGVSPEFAAEYETARKKEGEAWNKFWKAYGGEKTE